MLAVEFRWLCDTSGSVLLMSALMFALPANFFHPDHRPGPIAAVAISVSGTVGVSLLVFALTVTEFQYFFRLHAPWLMILAVALVILAPLRLLSRQTLLCSSCTALLLTLAWVIGRFGVSAIIRA